MFPSCVSFCFLVQNCRTEPETFAWKCYQPVNKRIKLMVLTTRRTRREVEPPSGNTSNFDLFCLFVSRPLALNICAHIDVCYYFATGFEHLLPQI